MKKLKKLLFIYQSELNGSPVRAIITPQLSFRIEYRHEGKWLFFDTILEGDIEKALEIRRKDEA